MPRVQRSNRKGKKYKVCFESGCIHFGARGFRVKPGTKAGNNYCARSSGIESTRNSPNYWARRLWGCVGKESVKRKAIKIGDIV